MPNYEKRKLPQIVKQKESFPLLSSFLNEWIGKLYLVRWCLIITLIKCVKSCESLGLRFEGNYPLSHLPLHLPCLNRQALGPATSAWKSAGSCIWRETEKSLNYYFISNNLSFMDVSWKLNLKQKKQKVKLNHNCSIYCSIFMNVCWQLYLV